MPNVPDRYADLLNKKSFAHLATMMPNGTPQVTPVWFEFDGSHILVNSALGRQKDKNMRSNPHVALSILDPDNPYRYLEIRGIVETITEEGGSAHIDKLAKKYLGVDKYPYANAAETRVIYSIKPEKFSAMG